MYLVHERYLAKDSILQWVRGCGAYRRGGKRRACDHLPLRIGWWCKACTHQMDEGRPTVIVAMNATAPSRGQEKRRGAMTRMPPSARGGLAVICGGPLELLSMSVQQTVSNQRILGKTPMTVCSVQEGFFAVELETGVSGMVSQAGWRASGNCSCDGCKARSPVSPPPPLGW